MPARITTATVPAHAWGSLVRPTIAASLIALALAVSATRAEAQFGKLKKIGGDLVKESARDAAGLPPKSDASGSSASGSSSRSSADRIITAERLDMVLVAIAPLVDAAKKEIDARAVRASYTERQKKQAACITEAGKNLTAYAPGYLEQMGAMTEQSTAMLERYAIATQTQNKRRMLFLEDSMAVMAYRQSVAMTGATRCGAPIYKPAAMIEAELARDTQHGSDARYDDNGNLIVSVPVPEATRKSMTHYQFGVLRERIALYAISEGDRSRTSTFTDAERAALDARSAELKALAPFFRDGLIRWTNWTDIKSW